MSNILKNSWMLFKRNKEYISTIVITPVIILVIFSFVLSFRSKVNLAVINLDGGELGRKIEAAVDDMDFVNKVSADSKDVEDDIMSDRIELAVVIKKNASDTEQMNAQPVRILKSKNSELADYIGAVLNAQIESFKSGEAKTYKLLQNTVSEKGIPITNALGMVIFKMIGSASMLAGLLIMERRNGIKNRISISKTKISVYLAGRGSIFFLHLLLFSFIYFAAAKLLNFDFGMKSPALTLIIFAVLGVFTTAFGLLLSTFMNDDNSIWNLSILVLLPSSILSGALFPFEAMPKTLQNIGSIFPQRWITAAIEVLQKGGTLSEAFVPLNGVLLLSMILFLIAGIRFHKSRNLF